MKYALAILLLFFGLLSGCNNSKYITVKHVKPINRNRFYNPKKDKKKKKVKYVKVKILKKSAEVKPAKAKPVKKKSVKSDSLSNKNQLVQPTNEADSTGSF